MSDPLGEYLSTLESEQQSGPTTVATRTDTGDPLGDYLNDLNDDKIQLQAMTPEMDNSTPDPPKQKHVYEGIIEFTQKFQQAREVGYMGLREAALGNQVKDGFMTLEEAERQIEEDDRLAELSGDLERYEKEAWDTWITGIPTSIGLGTAQMLPMLEASLVPYGIGFGVGGGLTAATGVGSTVAVPVGAMTGTFSAAGWMTDVIVGQEYLDRRRKGMAHEPALAAASISGVIQGNFGALQIGHVAKVPITAAQGILKATAQNAAQFMAEAAKFGGVQLGLAEAQTLTKLVTDAISGTVSNTPGVVPTVQQAWKEFERTFKATLTGSAGLFLGGKVIGAGAGLTAKAFKKTVQQAHDTHMENQAKKLQAIEDQQAAADGKPTEAQAPGSPDAPKPEKSKAAIEREQRAKVRLEKREAAEQEVKRIFSAAASLWRIESPETRLQETRRVQRLLKRMVSNSDLLDDKMKVTLLKRVVDIDGEAALLRLGERFIEEQRGREYGNLKAAADKRLKDVINAGKKKGKKAPLPPDVQASMDWYREFFTEPKPEKRPKGEPKREAGAAKEESRLAALEKARRFVEKGADEEIQALAKNVQKVETGELAAIFDQPAEVAEKRRIAMEAQAYWSETMTPEAVHALADRIENMRKEGRSEFLENKKLEVQKLLEQRQKVKDAVQGVKPVDPSRESKPGREQTGIGKILNSMRRNESALWDKLLQDTKPDEREGIVSKILSLTETENKEFEIVRKSMEDLSERYIKAVGSLREARRLIRDAADENQRIGLTFTDVNGVPEKKYYTVSELVYMHMAMQDHSAVPGLVEGNKYTLDGMVEAGHTSTQEAVRSFLTEHEGGKYLELSKALMDHYKWFSPMVANHYLKEYGVTLPMEPNYSGKIHHRKLELIQASDVLETAHDFAQRSLDPGSVKVRKNSKLPIVLVDPFKQIQSHQSQMAFWMANSEKARQLSFIFSDSSENGLRDVIKYKLGHDMLNVVDGRLAFQFHLKPGIIDIADRPLQDIRNRFSISILGGIRPDQRIKQLTGVFAPLRSCTWAEWREGLVKSQTDKAMVEEYIQHSELTRERQGELAQDMLGAIKDRDFLARLTGDRDVEATKFFMRDMKVGDGLGAKIGGFIEYHRMRKNGATPQEAALSADRLVNETMASSRPGQKTPNEMKKGQAALNAAFQKEGVQAFNRQAAAVRDAFIHHNDPATIRRAARIWFSVVAAQTMFETINNAPAFFVGDDDAKNQAYTRIGTTALFGGLTRIPGLGWDVATIVQGKEPRTISGAIAGDAAKFLRKAGKHVREAAEGEDVEITGEDVWTTLKALALAQGWWTGIPLYPGFKYLELGGDIAEKAQEGGE